MADIAEIHDQVLKDLLMHRNNHFPDLRFTLRKRSQERLNKGYWFLGNENYLAFSCWEGRDYKNKTPNIYFETILDGTAFLRLTAKDDPKKAGMLDILASILGGFTQVKVEEDKRVLWTKVYPDKLVTNSISTFLYEDMPRIKGVLDLFSSKADPPVENLFPEINADEFNASLKRILNLRDHGKEKVDPQDPKYRSLYLKSGTVCTVGLFDFERITFGKRVTAIIGENGGGKTTLLRAFALAIIGLGSKLIDYTSPKIQNLFKIVETDEGGIKYSSSLGSISLAYVFDEREFDAGQGTLININHIQQPEYISFHDHIPPEGFGISQLDGDGDGELKYLVVGYPQRYGIYKSQPDFKRSPKPSVFDALPLILGEEDQRMTSLKRWISEQWNTNDASKQKVKDLFSIASEILARNENETFEIAVISAVSEDKIIVSTPQHSQGIYFDLLSTGLNNLFGWLGHLISRSHEAYPDSEQPLHEPAIVFVDEIDNYLHPEVHAKLMPILLDTFKNTQFIITSHSPVILAGMPNTDAKAYRVTDGKIDEIQHFYGKRVADLLYEDFGLNDRPVPQIRSDIDEISSALANGRWEDAKQKLSVLREILGENDPAIIDATMEIEANTFFGNL
jgi:predicted ATP-binding protein involved in virulence